MPSAACGTDTAGSGECGYGRHDADVKSDEERQWSFVEFISRISFFQLTIHEPVELVGVRRQRRDMAEQDVLFRDDSFDLRPLRSAEVFIDPVVTNAIRGHVIEPDHT